jgi:hypothetical protein
MPTCHGKPNFPSSAAPKARAFGRWLASPWRLCRLKVVLATLGLVVLLAGCATAPPQLSQQEWLRLRLADGNDFSLTYPADGSGLKASRRWSIYMVIAAVFGAEEWTLKTAPRSDGFWVGVDVMGAIGGMVRTWSTPVDSQALYDLFWSRMGLFTRAVDRMANLRHAGGARPARAALPKRR